MATKCMLMEKKTQRKRNVTKINCLFTVNHPPIRWWSIENLHRKQIPKISENKSLHRKCNKFREKKERTIWYVNKNDSLALKTIRFSRENAERKIINENEKWFLDCSRFRLGFSFGKFCCCCCIFCCCVGGFELVSLFVLFSYYTRCMAKYMQIKGTFLWKRLQAGGTSERFMACWFEYIDI